MKPFIKPRPATSTAASPSPTAASSVTPGELSILTLASAITDPAERATYLDRACRGDATLRTRIDERLAAKATPLVPAQLAPPPTLVQAHHLEHTQPSGQSVALVPMTAAQLARATTPDIRPNTIPWLAATLLATAAGALAVLFSIEKANRANADLAAIEAQGESAEARQQRVQAEAAALEAKTAAERSAKAQQEAQQQRDAAVAAAEKEKAARESSDTIRAKAETQMKAAETAAAAARAEVEREQSASAHKQRAANATLADTLTVLATAQLDGRNYADATKSARQALDLRLATGATGWPLIDSHLTLGSALLQTNQDAAAAAEYLAAATAVESLPPSADPADKSRVADATKRILKFFSVTGRKKENAEWKDRFGTLTKQQAP